MFFFFFHPPPPHTCTVYTEVRVAPVGMCTLAGCPPPVWYFPCAIRPSDKHTQTVRRNTHSVGWFLVCSKKCQRHERDKNAFTFCEELLLLLPGQSIFVIHTWFVAVQSVCGVCMQIFKRRDKCIYISIPRTPSGSIFHQEFSAQSKMSGTAQSENSSRTKRVPTEKGIC